MREVKAKTVSEELCGMIDKAQELTHNGERVEIDFLKELRKKLDREIYGGYVVRTMKVSELVEDMRSHGMSTSAEKVKAFIMQGLYPFAIGCNVNTQQCEIYVKKYEQWLQDVGEDTNV